MMANDYNVNNILEFSREAKEKRQQIAKAMEDYRRYVDKLKAAYSYLVAERTTTDTMLELIKTAQPREKSDEEELRQERRITAVIQAEITKALSEQTTIETIRQAVRVELAGNREIMEGRRGQDGGVMEQEADEGEGGTFAEVVRRGRKASGRSATVKIHGGPPIPITKGQEITIGPATGHQARYKSADEVKQKVMSVVNPSAYGMKVDKMIRTRENSVKIAAKGTDVGKLTSAPELAEAGLEVRLVQKRKPRLIIYGVPSGCDAGKIPEQLMQHNRIEINVEEIKVVYAYKPRPGSRTTSVVIEVTPHARKQILELKELYVDWVRCRVEDHIRIMQCFKCQQFGHMAKDCRQADDVCGKCAGKHETRQCQMEDGTAKCANCCREKMNATDHWATNANICPAYRRRIMDRVRNTDYGAPHTHERA
ncbi:uncharacterized protein LOC125501477 [Athalia rosae]|uniref:uncharacterized protein LOC125501477 n=1 Tax=Athalia rosae TaxID=37344 RepID=UPI002033B147|nr:uncharacterized protein LOC125501477 [Athalia rosae]